MKKTAYRVPSPWYRQSTARPDSNPEETRRMANEDVLCVRFILIPAALLILFTQLPRLSSVLSFLVSSPERLGGLITGFVTGLYLHFRAQRRTKEEKEADRASAEEEFIPRTYHTFGD